MIRLSKSACLIMLSFSLAARSLAVEQSAPAAIVPARFPLAPYDEALYLPIEIDNERLLFLLDTGCSLIALGKDLPVVASLERSEMPVGGASGRRKKLPIVRCPRLIVPGAALPKKLGGALLVDFDTLRKVLDRPVEGVLGMPFFVSNVVQLDFDTNEWRALPVGTKPRADWGVELEVTYSPGACPQIRVAVADSDPISFKVDTGSNSAVTLDRELFQSLVESKKIELVSQTAVQSIHGKNTRRTAHGLVLGVANHRMQELPVLEGSENRIGLEFLRRYLVTFDLAETRIFLAPNKRFREPWPVHDGSIGTWRNDGRIEIAHVARYSEVSSTGLSVGDELVRLDGENVIDWPLGRVREQLGQADRPRRLVIRRLGSEVSITLPPSR
ncbi:hypothetical protein MalM25_02850 [Planctomycetes bacterium MalM25]|nr:hypothetical protein MalM25_02850 [Planctomycetes bacterium MalM25]